MTRGNCDLFEDKIKAITGVLLTDGFRMKKLKYQIHQIQGPDCVRMTHTHTHYTVHTVDSTPSRTGPLDHWPQTSVFIVGVVDDGPTRGQLHAGHGGHGPSKHRLCINHTPNYLLQSTNATYENEVEVLKICWKLKVIKYVFILVIISLGTKYYN